MKINEIFYSLQGEGCFTGTPAVFVRFSGCNRACAFCDTDFSHSTEMSTEEIISQINHYPASHVVLTGGEPALQVTEAFVDAIKDAGKFVQIETNGSLPVPDNIDWITCSPKVKPWGIQRVDEIKVVFQNQDVELIAKHFSQNVAPKNHPIVMSLQPCATGDAEADEKNIADTISYILDQPHWRLSLQTHKLLNIR